MKVVVNLNFLIVLLVLSLSKNVLSSLNGRLYGINQTATVAWFGIIDNDSKNYDRLIDLGFVWFSGGPSATRSVNSENYMIIYESGLPSRLPIYHLLTIDVTVGHRPKRQSNIKLDASTNGTFLQISDDDKQIIGIRQMWNSNIQCELATINKTNGQINITGLYPFNTGTFDMVFARQRRVYYTLYDSYFFYGINVDTGKLDVDLTISHDYSLNGIVYDPMKDRLITLVYSSKFVEKAWVLAEIIIENNSSSIRFQPIGNSTLSYIGYGWFSQYTIAVKDRQLITIWEDDYAGHFIFVSFDLDNGSIVTNHTMQPSPNLNSLVYFD